MPRSTIRNISRRELLAGAGAGAAALLLEQRDLQAQAIPSKAVVFAHTTVVNVDAVQDDVALVVDRDKIAAIGATDAILGTYPNADVYDGRGKALFPGLINCHAHMAAVPRTRCSTRTSASRTPRAWPSVPRVCCRGKRAR